MITHEMTTHRDTERGFALVGALFATVILALIAVAAISSAADERVSGRAMLRSAGAFYAANSGLAVELPQLDPRALDTLITTFGDSVVMTWQNTAGGGTYRTTTRWIGGSALKLYSLNVTGRGESGLSQRDTRLFVTEQIPQICCNAAISGGLVDEEARYDEQGQGGVTVSGYDTIPAQWAGYCDTNLVDIPGTEWRDTTDVRIEHSATLEGVPPLVQDPTISPATLFDWGALDYDALVAMADITFPDGTDLQSGIGPSLSGGSCNTSSNTNWGAPQTPSHQCADYFPIIHGQGKLRIRDNFGVGQGILLVDEELRVEDNFRFYGIIIAKGDSGDEIRLEDDVRVYGGLIAGDRVRVEDGASVRWSKCATERALKRLSFLRPMGSRGWEQASN